MRAHCAPPLPLRQIGLMDRADAMAAAAVNVHTATKVDVAYRQTLILGAQIGRGMQENRNQLLDVKLLVDKIAAGDFEEGKGLDEDSLKLIEDFLAAYDGYTPKVKKADLTNFGASLKTLRVYAT